MTGESEVCLVRGGIYELRARNLRTGVYDSVMPAGGAFIGLREKAGSWYLDSEYEGHTAIAVKCIGYVPEDMEISENSQLLEEYLMVHGGS